MTRNPPKVPRRISTAEHIRSLVCDRGHKLCLKQVGEVNGMTRQFLFFRIFVVCISAAALFYTAQGNSQQREVPYARRGRGGSDTPAGT